MPLVSVTLSKRYARVRQQENQQDINIFLTTRLLLFSQSIMPISLWPHGLQHARLPCPSPSPGACSNSCPSSQWCHPTVSFSVIPFSSCPQSFPAMSQLFTSGGQSIGASASSSVLPMNIQGWFPLGSVSGCNGFYLFIWLWLSACRILVPWPGVEPTLLLWKHRVLTTGQLGNSPVIIMLIFCINTNNFNVLGFFFFLFFF